MYCKDDFWFEGDSVTCGTRPLPFRLRLWLWMYWLKVRFLRLKPYRPPTYLYIMPREEPLDAEYLAQLAEYCEQARRDGFTVIQAVVRPEENHAQG